MNIMLCGLGEIFSAKNSHRTQILVVGSSHQQIRTKPSIDEKYRHNIHIHIHLPGIPCIEEPQNDLCYTNLGDFLLLFTSGRLSLLLGNGALHKLLHVRGSNHNADFRAPLLSGRCIL